MQAEFNMMQFNRSFLRRYNQKTPKVPPKNEQQVFCLLALLHLCRCQSTSQRTQAPLQQTHGNFGTCPAATSTAGTLKAPRRRGSGKAVPENIPQNPSCHHKDSPKSVKKTNSTKSDQTFKQKTCLTWGEFHGPAQLLLLLLLLFRLLFAPFSLPKAEAKARESAARFDNVTWGHAWCLALVTYNNRIIVINRFDSWEHIFHKYSRYVTCWHQIAKIHMSYVGRCTYVNVIN